MLSVRILAKPLRCVDCVDVVYICDCEGDVYCICPVGDDSDIDCICPYDAYC